MLGIQLSELLGEVPPGVEEALDLVAGLDDALVHGLGRLGEERATAFAALAGAMAGTPLGDRLGEAVEKIANGSVADEYLTALAGGRTALFGAVHDALLDRLDSALGRTRAEWAGLSAPASAPDNLLAGSRSWLRELAITGWRGVDHDLVSASSQTVEALLAEPGLRGLAVLLDGFAAELRASSPIATMDVPPARRWADLWARAVLLSHPEGRTGVQEAAGVTGRLLILGVDVHEHGTAVQVQVHGLLEVSGESRPRLVRTSVAAAKVDTIVGTAVWGLLAGYPVLMGALAERRSLQVADMPLTAGGDLVWQEERARPGEAADPFAVARVQLAGALAPAVPPLDRHPVRIAEPVLVEGFTAFVEQDGSVEFRLNDTSIPVAVDRLPACGPLTPELVAAASAVLGLMRWDAGRWSLQPFAVQTTVKRKPAEAHTGDWAMGPTDPKVVKAEAKAGDAVAVLRERAGRLLRR
ncbi:hypothetical protein [Rhizohabitans arisaemae]|uniref:hypothetical protein n=1 Tax=Rhizohabitans arisaemae TaxID=2720610 RepID=UPI0024B21D54|nr:hypothetical protein [Rhizohabitans arisaemae]